MRVGSESLAENFVLFTSRFAYPARHAAISGGSLMCAAHLEFFSKFLGCSGMFFDHRSIDYRYGLLCALSAEKIIIEVLNVTPGDQVVFDARLAAEYPRYLLLAI